MSHCFSPRRARDPPQMLAMLEEPLDSNTSDVSLKKIIRIKFYAKFKSHIMTAKHPFDTTKLT